MARKPGYCSPLRVLQPGKLRTGSVCHNGGKHIIYGKKCVLEGLGVSLEEGKYLFAITVFSSNAERKEIEVSLEFRKGKLKMS